MTLLVDSHCHLNFPDFKNDLDGVIARAREAGVGVMQTICTDLEEFDALIAITERYEHIYCSVGVHPNDTAAQPVPSVLALVERTAHPKVIGIGETGLDYYYDTSDRALQRESFRVHIDAARQTGLPLIVHTRDAEEDTIAILSEEISKGYFKGLIHCFTASAWLAEQAVNMGFYISLSGIITFKNAHSIRDALSVVPTERLLVETDAPYLAPIPYRGKRNEPAFVKYTNKMLADIKQISEEECARLTTANFFRLFDKALPCA